MTARLLDILDSEWKGVLARASHDIYHLPQYVAMSATGEGEEPVAFLYEDRQGQVLVPLVVRPVPEVVQRAEKPVLDATSPYGYPGPVVSCDSVADEARLVDAAARAFSKALRERGIISAFVRLHPHLDMPIDALRPHGELVLQGQTVTIDLSESDEVHWAQTRHNHRRGVNKAKRAGAQVIADEGWESLEKFIVLYHETMARQAASSFYFFDETYFHDLRSALGDAVTLLSVRLDGRVISAGLFTECNGIVQYHLSGTAADYLQLQPLKTMIHEARKWAKSRGNRWLHLGGGLGASQDSLFEFKAGFSPHRRDFYTWRVVTDADAYNRQVCRWEELASRPAEPVTGFFPPYRKAI